MSDNPERPVSGPPKRWLASLSRAQPALRWQLRLALLLGASGAIALALGLAGLVAAAAARAAPGAMFWVLLIAGIGLRWAAGLWREQLALCLSHRVRHDLRTRLLVAAAAMGPRRLRAQGNAGWWVQRHLDQVDALHGYLARYVPARMAVVWVPLPILLAVLWMDWVAAGLLLLALPLIPIAMAIIGMGVENVHEAQQDRQAALAADLLERLEALPWLRRMGALAGSRQAVAVAAQAYRKLSMRVLRVAFLSSASLEFFSAMAIGIVAIYIGFGLVGFFAFEPAASLTLLAGVFILLLAPECFLPLRQMAQGHHDASAARAAAESLMPWLGDGAVRPTPRPARSGTAAGASEAAVAADRVTYAYPGQEGAVLRDWSLTVAPGERVALAGPSGSGKSTVLALLAGFLAPQEGVVARAASWSWVPQQPHLFHDTLRNNLLLACPAGETPDDAVLLKALAKAGLPLPDPLLPQGLETPIGELNAGVSGGQAQRIAFARAILQGAQLWLLDEPTAALDAQARDIVLAQGLAAAREQGAAVIVASHDPAVWAVCDRVLPFPLPGGEGQAP